MIRAIAPQVAFDHLAPVFARNGLMISIVAQVSRISSANNVTVM